MTTQTTQLDLDRLPYEIKRSIEASGEGLIEQFDPGTIRVLGNVNGEIVLGVDGTEIARVLQYRLEAVDEALLGDAIERIIETLPDDAANEVRRLGKLGQIASCATPDSDFVTVLCQGLPLGVVDRALVVKGWPTTSTSDES